MKRRLSPFWTLSLTCVTFLSHSLSFTGFVCYFRGWQDFRDDNFGVLWEHFVLNEIAARLQSRGVFCWRDKRGHEVDFGARGDKPTLSAGFLLVLG